MAWYSQWHHETSHKIPSPLIHPRKLTWNPQKLELWFRLFSFSFRSNWLFFFQPFVIRGDLPIFFPPMISRLQPKPMSLAAKKNGRGSEFLKEGSLEIRVVIFHHLFYHVSVFCSIIVHHVSGCVSWSFIMFQHHPQWQRGWHFFHVTHQKSDRSCVTRFLSSWKKGILAQQKGNKKTENVICT